MDTEDRSGDTARAYKIATDQIHGMRYMYWHHVVGLVGTVCGAYSVPLNQDTIDGIKEALVDELYQGVDIEWEDYGMYQWWENLSPDWFALVPSQNSYDGKPCAPSIKCSKKPTDFKE